MYNLYKARGTVEVEGYCKMQLMRIEDEDNGFTVDLSGLSSDSWNIQG